MATLAGVGELEHGRSPCGSSEILGDAMGAALERFAEAAAGHVTASEALA